jgi:hypothetical protein
MAHYCLGESAGTPAIVSSHSNKGTKTPVKGGMVFGVVFLQIVRFAESLARFFFDFGLRLPSARAFIDRCPANFELTRRAVGDEDPLFDDLGSGCYSPGRLRPNRRFRANRIDDPGPGSLIRVDAFDQQQGVRIVSAIHLSISGGGPEGSPPSERSEGQIGDAPEN